MRAAESRVNDVLLYGEPQIETTTVTLMIDRQNNVIGSLGAESPGNSDQGLLQFSTNSIPLYCLKVHLFTQSDPCIHEWWPANIRPQIMVVSSRINDGIECSRDNRQAIRLDPTR
jgi:hypothetical protein